MKKRVIFRILSIISLIFGVFFLINSKSNITGAVIGVIAATNSFFSLFLGILFIISSVTLFLTAHSKLEKITLSSAIKKSPSLLRLTQDAVRNQTVERELNNLIKELSKGNFEAGLGHPGHIKKTNVYYLRGDNGARLYYRRIGENSYEIVAKSTKGRNQDRVINIIKETYGD